MYQAARLLAFQGGGSGGMTGAVAVSCAIHVAAFASVVGGTAPSSNALLDPPRVTVRTIEQTIPRMRPEPVVEPTPPPPPPEPIVQAPPPPSAQPPAPRTRRKPVQKRPRAARSAPLVTGQPVQIATSAGGAVAVVVPDTPPEPSPVVQAAAPPHAVQAPPFDLSGYGEGVHGALLAERRYPAEARDLDLEGEVLVQIAVDRDGALARPPRVVRSSGHKCLDREALRMVVAAAPFASLPAACSNEIATFTVPIRFELDTGEF